MPFSPANLRRVAVFANASDEDIAFFLQNSITRSVEEGEYFFLQGDPAEYLYILTAGQAKLMESNPAGQQVNLRTIYPWQMFGALGAVRQEATYPASAQALEDSSALGVSSAVLKDMMQTRPELSMGLMQIMTPYIQEMQEWYRELATERVQQRIARALLRVASLSGQQAPDGIELAFSRQDIAEMCGTTLHREPRADRMGTGGAHHFGEREHPHTTTARPGTRRRRPQRIAERPCGDLW